MNCYICVCPGNQHLGPEHSQHTTVLPSSLPSTRQSEAAAVAAIRSGTVVSVLEHQVSRTTQYIFLSDWPLPLTVILESSSTSLVLLW